MRKFGSGHGGRGKGKPRPVDVHVGAWVRRRRTQLGMSQTALSDVLGLTFQQVQRYENATNRIAASRLYDLSQALDVPVGYFFEEMPPEVAASSPALGERETLELLRAHRKIKSPKIRKRLYEITKALAAASSKDD